MTKDVNDLRSVVNKVFETADVVFRSGTERHNEDDIFTIIRGVFPLLSLHA